METPLHHHKNDGGFYQDCQRCKMERSAPELIQKTRVLVESLDTLTIEGTLEKLTIMSEAIKDVKILLEPFA